MVLTLKLCNERALMFHLVCFLPGKVYVPVIRFLTF